MANAKPYYTSNDLVESLTRKISFPTSQSTFTYSDFLKFLNEELQLSAVPALKELHEEFFVYSVYKPLVNGISIYPIPDRAMAMALRDLNWVDQSGNFFKMSRIAEENKAYFQVNVGSNQALGKYYLQGNNIVLTPQIVSGATGQLDFSIYLRPNTLVRNDRAATIQNFQKPITITNNSVISAGDTVTIVTGNQTPAPNVYTFTATTGSPLAFQFLIGANATITAANLNTAINNQALEDLSSSVLGSVITTTYTDITSTFTVLSSGITTDNKYTYVQFDQLPSTYTDPDTNQISSLYTQNSLVDFLQTNPGHKTFTYDVKLRQILTGNIGKFLTTDLMTWLNNSGGGVQQFLPILIGDYICLQNECIIPQIPPELHSALAERGAAAVQRSIGDQAGYAQSQAKIAEMDKQQATLVGQRVDGSVPKVLNTFSLLRLGKRSSRRRL